MSHNPGVDIANYLDANSTAVTLGTNLWYGPVRANSTNGAVPVEAVFVMGVGGREPDRVLGTATEIRFPTVQVRVRSSGFAAGAALAQTVNSVLQSASPSTGNAYLDVMALQSEPVFVEQDKNMHYHWSLNYRCVLQTT